MHGLHFNPRGTLRMYALKIRFTKQEHINIRRDVVFYSYRMLLGDRPIGRNWENHHPKLTLAKMRGGRLKIK